MALSTLIQPLFSPSTWPTSVYIVLLTTAALGLYSLAHREPLPANAPKPASDNLPVLGSTSFFSRRGDFLRNAIAAASTGQFSFYVGKHQVVGLSGDDGRRTFFESRDLDLTSGYAALFNARPTVDPVPPPPPDAHGNDGPALTAVSLKNIVKLTSRAILTGRVPILVSDAIEAMDDIRRTTALPAPAPAADQKQQGNKDDDDDEKNAGVLVMDPFDHLYRLVYRLTIRTLGADEIATNPRHLRETLSRFEDIEGAGTTTGVIFPWLPTLGKMKQLWGGYKWYTLLDGIAKARAREGRREDDAMQVLLDQGEPMLNIVECIIGGLFAGQINSGINAGWLLVFLAKNEAWYARIRAEVDAAVAKRRRASGDGDGDEDQRTPAEVLASLTIGEWEAEFPMIDLGLKETIRHTVVGCGFRLNVSGRPVPIGKSGQVIPKDAFAVYLFDDLQMNGQVYSDPEVWDPSRFLPGREEDKNAEAHGYIGWGSGRHPCLGMRFAKMEMAITTAVFFASFDFCVCDDEGNPTDGPLPPIDRNMHSATRPKGGVKFRLTPRT